ncbi:MAG: hypothetical protein NW241_01415 [Bacteroidia bacterium]|nr:hypothetical protein [Bacteroidia bacterium]
MNPGHAFEQLEPADTLPQAVKGETLGNLDLLQLVLELAALFIVRPAELLAGPRHPEQASE